MEKVYHLSLNITIFPLDQYPPDTNGVHEALDREIRKQMKDELGEDYILQIKHNWSEVGISDLEVVIYCRMNVGIYEKKALELFDPDNPRVKIYPTEYLIYPATTVKLRKHIAQEVTTFFIHLLKQGKNNKDACVTQ